MKVPSIQQYADLDFDGTVVEGEGRGGHGRGRGILGAKHTAEATERQGKFLFLDFCWFFFLLTPDPSHKLTKIFSIFN